jgi:hypothetical protein
VRKSGCADGSSGTGQRAGFFSRSDERYKILNLGDALRRQGLNLFKQGLGVLQGLVP